MALGRRRRSVEEPRSGVVQEDSTDEEIAEVWSHDTHQREVRGVTATRWVDGGDWPWRVAIWAAEFVREEPLDGEMRRALDAALRAVPGVTDVAEEDTEVWIVGGDGVSGEALVRAAAAVMNGLADRILAAYPDLG